VAVGGSYKARVSVTRCGAYDVDLVRDSLRRLLEPLGGLAAFAQPGERILLKPNLLLAVEPARAITTHPALVEVLAGELLALGAQVIVFDSPGAGMPHTRGAMNRVYRRTGMAAAARRTGAELSFDLRVEGVGHPGGRLVRRVDLVRVLREVDGIISLPKLKTHTFMGFTGAVKNLFGAVPGLAKPGYHAKLPDAGAFADMLLDVVQLLAPRLHVMDGVLALEGDGPGTGGRPREAGLLLASSDPVAIDAVATRLVGMPWERVPTMSAAQQRGLWSGDLSGIEVLAPEGAGLDDLAVKGFALPRQAPDPTGFMRTGRVVRTLTQLANDSLNATPRPAAGRCTACGNCVRACPTGAMSLRSGLAVVEKQRCIRCYCCHELCPQGAVELDISRLGRLIRGLGLM
jgi:uncharacterized protein (DUF362 family)/NAD-dependent dihydropyrimidine dehydrogenase PreA subunit